MPVYDTKCDKCKKEKEVLTLKISEKLGKCECGGKLIKLAPSSKSPSFKLVYDNKKDMVDWDGNTSRYWDDYKKQKAQGKNVRIPKFDGDG